MYFINCTHYHHQDAEMTEIHRGKSKWCKIRTTASLPQEKRECLGYGEAMTLKAIPSTYKFFQDHLNYLKMVLQENKNLILFISLGY